MNTTRTLAIVVLWLVLSTRGLQGQDRSRSRDVQLGGDVPSVSALANVAASDAQTFHQRPAVMQVERRPPYCVSGPPAPQNDLVQQIVFGSSHDQGSKVVVENKTILPWGLRRAGAGVGLTVSGVDLSIQRNGFTLSKSVTF